VSLHLQTNTLALLVELHYFIEAFYNVNKYPTFNVTLMNLPSLGKKKNKTQEIPVSHKNPKLMKSVCEPQKKQQDVKLKGPVKFTLDACNKYRYR